MISIFDKHDCCGCTACQSICSHSAITLIEDEEGFKYPQIDVDKCLSCNLCDKVCPIIQRDAHSLTYLPEQVLAAHNKDMDIWFKSSSGGVFAALTEYCINKNGIVYGAAYNEKLTVVHCGEDTLEGTVRFRGSKYAQSDMTGVYREVREWLINGRLVLFSGTPCQVDGLHLFLRKSYVNLITVDILFHGVPSPMIFSDYVDFINKNSIGKLTDINMKDKTFGWGCQNLRLFFDNGASQFNTIISTLWNKLFYGHNILRPSCYNCRFTNLNRPGDITIGDFWGVENSLPDFHSTNGISLILCNNTKGSTIWNDIKDKFEYRESSIEDCLQPALCKNVDEPAQRIHFWENYLSQGFSSILKDYQIKHGKLRKNMLMSYLRTLIK